MATLRLRGLLAAATIAAQLTVILATAAGLGLLSAGLVAGLVP